MKKYLRYLMLPLAILMLIGGGCGDDSSGGGNRRRRSASGGGQSRNLNKNRRKKKMKKSPNINFFADENLSIPPFNKKARNIPPEMFVEKDKIQRDPFKNLYQPVNIGNDNSNQNVTENKDTVVLMERSSLAQIKLTGIVWSAGREKALFTDGNKQPTVVMKGDVISSSKAIVKEITHDKVILEIPSSNKDEAPKNIVFVLEHQSVPYQIQYEKLRPDQRGIRVHLHRRFRRKK